jgi:hypothetical protein
MCSFGKNAGQEPPAVTALRGHELRDGEILTKGRLTRTFEGWMGIEIVISQNWSTSGGQTCKRSEI